MAQIYYSKNSEKVSERNIKEVGSDVAQVPRILRIRDLRSALYGSLGVCADAGGAILRHLGAVTFWHKYTIVEIEKR